VLSQLQTQLNQVRFDLAALKSGAEKDTERLGCIEEVAKTTHTLLESCVVHEGFGLRR
jgi:hypothetical protein